MKCAGCLRTDVDPDMFDMVLCETCYAMFFPGRVAVPPEQVNWYGQSGYIVIDKTLVTWVRQAWWSAFL